MYVDSANKKTENTRLLGELYESLQGRPLVLYGPMVIGTSILGFFNQLGLPITHLCDVEGNEGEIHGIPLISARALKNDMTEATVVVCPPDDEFDCQKSLADMGFSKERILPWKWVSVLLLNHLLLISGSQFQCHIDKYAWAYDLFDDNKSKLTVLDRLCYYLCNTDLKINTRCSQYFEDDYIQISAGEIFADCGGYTGDTVLEFIRRANSAGVGYSNIYSFEPGQKNYLQAVENTAIYPNVTIIPKGLWSSETELEYFENSDSLGSSFMGKAQSLFMGLGQIGLMSVAQPGDPRGTAFTVPVTTLDSFFAGKPDSELPTFIKMDIEGSEKEALIGARDIIRRVKPKLAICAYHKPEDVYSLPQTIMKIRNDYRFALRHYTQGWAETVLYAV